MKKLLKHFDNILNYINNRILHAQGRRPRCNVCKKISEYGCGRGDWFVCAVCLSKEKKSDNVQ